jgi:OmpA-OmpF porin, OOP family
MSLKKTLLAATFLSLPLAAQAQPVTGIYVGAGGGVNIRNQVNQNGFRITSENPGWVGLGSIGYGLGNGFRVEVEGNYRHNSIRRSTFTGGFTGSSGSLRTYGGMVNALYDFNLASLGLPTISPYVGVGVGYGQSSYNRVTLRSGVTSLNSNGNSGNGNFAYQGIAGVAFGLGAIVPGLALTTEYRYYGTLDTSQRFTVSAPGVAIRAQSGKLNNGNHDVLIGLRYNFGVAPAPVAAVVPVAATPATVARTYLVFFDWNRADLTPRAREIIGEAAQASRTANVTRLEVSGHADRSGTPAYNQGLSQRRAEAVAADLVSKGVSRAAISIQAFGESRPLVPTADNVREPQNRRVEIVLR